MNAFRGPQGQSLGLVSPSAEGVSVFFSEYDTINWNRLFPKGIRFAALRVSPTAHDRTNSLGDANKFPANWSNMLSTDPQDIVRGAFWEFDPKRRPVDQATTFVSLITNSVSLTWGYGEVGDLPLILMVINAGGQPPDTLAKNIKITLEWIEKQTGRAPILYTTPDFWNTYLLDTPRARIPACTTGWTLAAFRSGIWQSAGRA